MKLTRFDSLFFGLSFAGLSVALTFLLGGCTLKPTTGDSFRELPLDAVVITPETIVLDARSAFNYGLAHVPGSYNVPWAEFAHVDARSHELARRLSLLGIGIDTPVLVVGAGRAGRGEEGRLAWSLARLGLSHVQWVGLVFFGKRLTQQESPSPKNIGAWTEVLNESLIVSPKNIPADARILEVSIDQNVLSSPALLLPAKAPGGQTGPGHENQHACVKNSTGLEVCPDRILSLDWREFVAVDGRLNLKVLEKLHGWPRGEDIYVHSPPDGISGALVTMALRALGYTHARNATID